ncbi:MAG TPA: tRNA-intron lyase [Candidatus Thermoplasmatota archaeon]|nr:tRNA-intron lyase [Candidatus Thermoplasmatota archaeon]
MEISGELTDHTILIKKATDVGRLYNKSHLGTPLRGDQLSLDLLEGVLLLDEKKMRLFHRRQEVEFPELVTRAAEQIPGFETKYLVFKDLRSRGHPMRSCDKEPPTFYRYRQKHDTVPPCYVCAFSERDILDIDTTSSLIQRLITNEGMLWFGLVDEEGDITYYDVAAITLKGGIKEQRYKKGAGLLLKNRVIIFDPCLAKQLLENEFIGKPFGDGLQLSFVEALYLAHRDALELYAPSGAVLSLHKVLLFMKKLQPDIDRRLSVFTDLKQRGMLVKTGFKFGAHFRAYTQQPDRTHAEYLIHVVEHGFTSIWAEISRAVRLAHSVNKEFVFARVSGSSIDYVKLGRLRP